MVNTEKKAASKKVEVTTENLKKSFKQYLQERKESKNLENQSTKKDNQPS